MHVPKGSRLGKVVDEIAPVGDEIVIPKTSSGVFNSTNMEYVLRNLGVEYLMCAGVFTNQCVESAVRDAADRGFMVTTIEDCCATKTKAGHDASIAVLKGYSRIRSTDQVVAELAPPQRKTANR
jgi:ureidoacrylate peracid hydrolase